MFVRCDDAFATTESDRIFKPGRTVQHCFLTTVANAWDHFDARVDGV